MVALCSRTKSDYPELSRTRNARLIMSSVIPDEMYGPECQPYCTWNSDIAREDTYRELSERCPSMRYQVSRACAAAGYVDLYKELCLLPHVSIAEEARECDTPGGNEIFQIIMASPIKYAVMDDFTRSINTKVPKTPAFLNGNATVRWTLEAREPPRKTERGIFVFSRTRY